MKCSYHPDVDTNLACSNCGKPICPKEMVYTPAGIKCPDCARPARGMRARGKPRDWAFAALAGVAMAVGGGIVLGEFLSFVRFFSFIVVLGFGLLTGEVISRAARHNTGLYYQLVAALSVVLGLFVSVLVSRSMNFLILILGGAFGVAAAVARLRD